MNLSLRRLTGAELYPDETDRFEAKPTDDRDFEIRVTVPNDAPFSPYLTLFASTDPSGLPRPSANLAADELVAIGRALVDMGERLIGEYRTGTAT